MQPGMFGLTDTECNALFMFNVSQHRWLLNAAWHTEADELFFFSLSLSLSLWDITCLLFGFERSPSGEGGGCSL